MAASWLILVNISKIVQYYISKLMSRTWLFQSIAWYFKMASPTKILVYVIFALVLQYLAHVHGKEKDDMGENETETKVKMHCIVNGKRYRMYQKIRSKTLPRCGRCYCSPSGKVVCGGPVCPRGYCVDGVYNHGQCCPDCPRGRWLS